MRRPRAAEGMATGLKTDYGKGDRRMGTRVKVIQGSKVIPQKGGLGVILLPVGY